MDLKRPGADQQPELPDPRRRDRPRLERVAGGRDRRPVDGRRPRGDRPRRHALARLGRVQGLFPQQDYYRDSFEEIARAFLVNVRIFLIVEAVVLVTALLMAILRSLPGPVFFLVRALAVVYVDFFRGVPTILVILMLGQGIPALQLSWLPISGPDLRERGARARLHGVRVRGLPGGHRVGASQEAAARSLGLTRGQALRHVVVPQAVRRVIPPLLNDFIGLQKDTALVSVLGIVEALRQTQIDQAATFNGTYYPSPRRSSSPSRSRSPGSRTGSSHATGGGRRRLA